MPNKQQEGNEERLVLTMDRNLYFPSVERFRNALTRVSLFNAAPNRTIVIDMSRINRRFNQFFFPNLINVRHVYNVNLDAQIDAIYLGQERREIFFYQRKQRSETSFEICTSCHDCDIKINAFL